MTPEQEKALALARARKRRAEAGNKSPAMAEGLASLSGMTQNPRVGPQERGLGAMLYDNVVGSDDGVQSWGEDLGTWLNRGGETMTLGLVGDEASAAAYSALPGRTYEGELDRFRTNEENMSGMGKFSADIVGSLVPGLGGLSLVSRARTLPGAVAAGMGFGGAAGATQGFMEGEGGLSNRMMNSGIGAGIGAAFGGAIPLVGAGIQRGARAFSDMRRAGNVGNEIGDALGVSNTAGRVVGDLLSPEDPAAMRAAMGKAGPRAMLADASPTTGAMLDATMRSPTPGARLAGERVAGRAATAGDEIIDALSGGRQGPRQGVQSVMDGIRKGTAGARSAAYDAAYSKPINYAGSPNVNPSGTLASNGVNLPALAGEIVDPNAGPRLLALQDRLPAEAINYANRLMKLRGETSQQIMADVAEDGTVKFTTLPDVRQWDYIKQALDGLAESGDGAGALGGQTRLGSAYQGLAREVRDNLAAAVPEYKVALDTAADAITRRNAVKFGADLLSPSVTTEEALSEIATATGGQKAAMRDGLRGYVDEIIGNVKAVGSDQNIDARQALKAFTEFSSPNAKRKMEALFGDEWPAIATKLDEAGAALGLRARTAANSATNQRTVVQEAITDSVTPGALARGRPVPALGNAWATLMNANPDAIKRMGRDVQGEIADLLTREGQGPQAVDAIVNALTKNPVNTTAGKTVRRVIEALLLGNTGRTTEAGLETLGMRGQ